jgi:hypothetical protein
VSEGPSAEELVAELRKASVDDFLVHTCSLLASLAFGKLAPESRDLEQARRAVEALKALGAHVPAAAAGEVQALVASLQLAYAEAVQEPPESPVL